MGTRHRERMFADAMIGGLSLFILLCTATFSARADAIETLGSEIRPSSSGQEQSRVAFLLKDQVETPGIVFGFSAFFVARSLMRFQIWRPSETSSYSYELIGQWEVLPDVEGARQDVHIKDHDNAVCLRVQKGDRLAVYNSDLPASVGANFQASAAALRYTENRDNDAYPETGNVLTFDSLQHPYEFSAAAFIDTDLSKYGDDERPDCDDDLVIPRPDLATAPPVMGATGPTGPQGEQGPRGPTGPTGDAGPAGAQGSRGSRGPTGSAGSQGDSGATGPTGPTGERGATGAQGLQGEQGMPGMPGEAMPASLEQLVDDCDWCEKLLDPYLILALIIWLALVTIGLVAVAIIVLYRRRGFGPIGKYNKEHWSSQADLWKKYDTVGRDNAAVEGRTSF